MRVLVLCPADRLDKEMWGYARAFRRLGVQLECVAEGTPLNASIGELSDRCPGRPDLIFQSEPHFNLLPQGLVETDIPSVCFHFDTHAYTERRIRWSMLFDYPVLFHPGFEALFRRAGHPNPVTLAHAAPRDLFEGRNEQRVFEVGWVGRLTGASYKMRERILPQLAGRFRMNDWEKSYTPQEMAEVYLRSQIVVNIGRDDFPQDANMRVFEAMAAGALLITSLPTELAEMGFVEGEHFIGYRKEQELLGEVRHYLSDEAARCCIAHAGREKVLGEHTYDCRVKTLLEAVRGDKGKLFAPARSWPSERVALAYLDYYAATANPRAALTELRKIWPRSLQATAAGASLIGRTFARRWKARILSALPREN